MGTYLKKSITMLGLVCVLLGICSCRIADSYSEFCIERITGHDISDYLSNECLDFAKVDGVLIIPAIKEIVHEEYVIYISTYSKIKPDRISIKAVSLRANNTIILESAHIQRIDLEKDPNEIYSGTIDYESFILKNVNDIGGQEIDLVVQVEVTSNGESTTEDVVFNVEYVTYKTLLMP